jgi:hypothetical protein
MEANTVKPYASLLGLIILGTLALILILAGLTGLSLPFLKTDKALLIALFVTGFFMCGRGLSTYLIRNGKMLSPLWITGLIFGMLASVVMLSAFTSISLPLVTDAKSAFIALAVIMGIKAAIATVYQIAVTRHKETILQ